MSFHQDRRAATMVVRQSAWPACWILVSVLLASCVDLPRTFGEETVVEWPEFRGPDGLGQSSATGLPLTWGESEHVAWRTDLPGRGWSSPVIRGDDIWLTTAFEEKLTDEQLKAKRESAPGGEALSFIKSVRLHALCLDRKTGSIRHNIELSHPVDPQPSHAMNSFASPTAILTHDRLYCCFGAYGSYCIDTSTGQKLWGNTDLVVQHENGPGSTPVLWQGKYIVHFDGSDKQFLAALDADTGQVVWTTPRSGVLEENPQLKKAYGTPILLHKDGQTVVASPAANWVYGYDPATGKELWKVPYGELGFSTVPRPVTGNGLLYVVTGFMQSKLLALRLADDLRTEPTLVWSFDKQVPTIPSPLLAGPFVYFVSDKGIVTCLDALSGELRWRERVGGNFVASPLHADGRIYLFSREGTTTVLPDDGRYEVLAQNELPGEVLASPAAVGQAIFVRTSTSMYRLESRQN